MCPNDIVVSKPLEGVDQPTTPLTASRKAAESAAFYRVSSCSVKAWTSVWRTVTLTSSPLFAVQTTDKLSTVPEIIATNEATRLVVGEA